MRLESQVKLMTAATEQHIIVYTLRQGFKELNRFIDTQPDLTPEYEAASRNYRQGIADAIDNVDGHTIYVIAEVLQNTAKESNIPAEIDSMVRLVEIVTQAVHDYAKNFGLVIEIKRNQ